MKSLAKATRRVGTPVIIVIVMLAALVIGGAYFSYRQFLAPPTPLIANPPTLNFPCFGAAVGSAGTTVVTLDNSASNDTVEWSVTSISQAAGGDWAAVSPSSGTIGAGQTEKIIVTPISQLCQNVLVQNLLVYITYHKTGAVSSQTLVLATVAVGGVGFPTGSSGAQPAADAALVTTARQTWER